MPGPAGTPGPCRARRRSEAKSVVQVNDTAAEPALGHELQLDANAVRQRALPAADEHRDEEQVALIDQARGHRLAGELGTADRDVAGRGLLRRLIAAGSKSRSIRVRSLDGACRVREYTIFSAARQICAKSRVTAA